VPPLARLGYAAKGIVYLLVGYLAARAAFAAGSPTGATGALREMLHDGGRWLVLLVGIGLLAHVVWRLVQATLDPECPHGGHRFGLRLFYLLSGLVYGSIALSAFDLFRGRDGGEEGEKHLAAVLLSQPFGPWLVGAVGLGVIGYGIHELLQAFRGDVAKRLGIRDPQQHRIVLAIGRLGTAARGVVLAIVGAFFIDAARHYDPNEAGGTEDALRWLGQGWLLGAVALGLMAYGVLQLAKARYRRFDTPAA
jgi:hypothetical protein